jgi:hypothetical protein
VFTVNKLMVKEFEISREEGLPGCSVGAKKLGALRKILAQEFHSASTTLLSSTFTRPTTLSAISDRQSMV